MLPLMENLDAPVSSYTSRTEQEQEIEFLTLLAQVHDPTPHTVEEIFRCLQCWWQEVGPSNTLQNAVCEKLLIDQRVFTIYRQCPSLVDMMESLRKGVPIRRARERWRLTEEDRRWWTALLVVRVLLKTGGVIAHVRLIRWLGHRADATQIRSALALLREVGLLETYPIKGTDPLRPVTWHRLTIEVEDTPKTSMDSLSAPMPV
jgi:hypothetical protein